LRVRADRQPFALQLGGQLAGAPHVERDLADLEACGQGADLVGDLEDR